MANNRTLTSANSTFVLTIGDLGIASFALSGFATDNIFTTEDVEVAEVRLGVDGNMSWGWIPRMFPMTINLQADSTSRDLFDNLILAEDAARTKFRLDGVITMPALSKAFTLTKGIVTRYKAAPDAAKVLEPTSVVITWNQILPAGV
jgi:hypothetical protein